ncbi:MAG: hypothetical protein IT374_26175 [Polyangiaceae bacterium]|nr:hypothetical protein [Polyangiaceae bacterium]
MTTIDRFAEQHGIVFVGEGTDRVSTCAVPLAVAREYERLGLAAGREVSWAPDHDDRKSAWIYEVAS